jgi:GNAT superfamily N-acetyltransferase
MTVRRASVADAEQIAEIHVRSWQHAYRGLIPQDYLDGLDPAQRVATRRQRLAEEDWTRGGCLVVTGAAGAIAGFANVGPSRDEAAGAGGPTGERTGERTGGRTGEVRAIYLSPGAWGHGLGRVLMDSALAHLAACGYDQVILWVLESNARARRFYAAAGFRPDGGTKVDQSRGFALHEVRYRRALP